MDDLTLLVGDKRFSGWTQIRVTRGIEQIPSNFDVVMTDLYPGDIDKLTIAPGDSCQVYLGTDLVITGFVDRLFPSFAAHNHQIRVTGRGACQDLIDCSADWPGCQISGSNALQVAKILAQPFAISVSSDGNDGPQIPQLNFSVEETPFQILETITRYAGLLFYDMPDGNLRLSQAASESHASGFEQGKNVEAASYMWGADLRYSKYSAYLQTMQTMGDTGANLVPAATAEDKTVRRPRPYNLVSEQVQSGRDIAQQRVDWENTIRAGRSQVVRVTADSWRDMAGNLWTVNTLVPVNIPFLKIPAGTSLLISEVSFLLNEQGTHAELVLLPRDAFIPQPIILQPLSPDMVFGAGTAN